MRYRAGWVLLLLLCAGSVANADDWRQLMRDEYRSNASRDRVPVPLTHIWTSPRSGRISELIWRKWQNPCVIDQGRIFHITLEPGAARVLEALEARTGQAAWKVPLNRLHGTGNLFGSSGNWTAVTRNGWVIAYDFLPAGRLGLQPVPQDAPPVRNGSAEGNPTVRAFRADLGLPLDAHALLNGFKVPITNAVDQVHRVFMFDRPFPFDQHRMPYVSNAYPDDSGLYWGPEFPLQTMLGPPLISGEEVAATENYDCFFRWMPRHSAQYFRLTHVHPRNANLGPESIPHNPLSQFPLVKLPTGYLVADMSAYKYLAAFNPDATDGRTIRWHMDLKSSVGIPCAEGRSVFMGVNGKSADSGIMAVDSATGEVRWVYPFGVPIAERTREDQKLHMQKLFSYQPGTQRMVSATDRGGSGGRPGRRPDRGGAENRRAAETPDIPAYIPVRTWIVDSANAGAHRANRGLVLSGGRVFGVVGSSLVALDQRTGKQLWAEPLSLAGAVVSIAGTRSHVILSHRQTALTPNKLSAYRMENGKKEWEAETPVAGPLSIASGVVFIGAEGAVFAFAPAERTFALGIDSDLAADYRPLKYHEERAEGDTDEERVRNSLDPTKPVEQEQESPKEVAARIRALGEASVVRIAWGRPVQEMLAEVQKRRRQLPGVPLVLSLDWLSPKRNALMTPSQGKWWKPDEIEAYARACALLAQAANPYYIDIAPEVNVYLAHFPELTDQVLAFVQRVREAVKSANASTRVVASFNADLLLDRYGKTTYVPFGVVPRPRPWKLSRLEPILASVDAIGITLRPQTGFVFAGDVPSNYLFPLREWFGRKPLVVTSLDVRNDIDVKKGGDKQRDFLEQALKTLYWMEAKVVAVRLYGEGEEDAELALRTVKTERPALEVWRHVNSWRLVNYLTSELALAKKETMPDAHPAD